LELDGNLLHNEAEQLEHVVSDQLMHHIDKYLDFPTVDPHGSSIPCLDIKLDRQFLNKVKIGNLFTVDALKVNDKTETYLVDRAFTVGSVWELVDSSPDKSSFLVTDGRKFLSLSAKMSDGISVIIKQ
jgi:DtxR family Mn-dependent transcriptional regulator